MVEKLLANPCKCSTHHDYHLIYVDEICGFFKFSGLPGDIVKKKVFPLSLEGKALMWLRLFDNTGSRNLNRLKLECHEKFYPMHLIHHDRNFIYNSGLTKDKVALKLWGGLNLCCTLSPTMSSQEN